MVTENQSAGHSSAVSSTAVHVPASRLKHGAYGVTPQASTKYRNESASVSRTRGESLPFVVTSHTRRGRWLCVDHFDPEILDDRDANIVGFKALASLLEALKNQGRDRSCLDARSALIDAGKKASCCGSASGHAAFSFMCAAADMLHFAANSADWKRYIADRIASAEQDKRWLEEMKTSRKDEFVSRMRAAKAAKRRAAAPSTVQTPVGAQQ